MRNRYLANEYQSIWLFISLMLIYALVYMTKNCYSAAMVLLVDEGVLTKSQTGVISAAFYIVYAPLQIVGGLAADKYPPHKLIATGLIGATVANVLIVLNTNYYFMLIVWSLNGAIQFGIWPAVFRMISVSLAPVHRHKGVFYIALASTLGIVLSYGLAGMVSSWKMNFVVSAIVLFICTVYWIPTSSFFERNMVDEDVAEHGVSHLPEAAKNTEDKKDGLMSLIIRSGIILALPVAMIQTVLSTGVQSVTPSMIAESYDRVSPSLASVLTVVPVVMGVIGKVGMKWIYGRMNHSECSVMAGSIIISIPLICAMLFVGRISVLLMVCIISVMVLISNASYLMLNPYMTVVFSRLGRGATISGIINATASVGIVVANLVSTRIADTMGWKAVIVSWIIFAVTSALFAILAYFPWKRFKKSIEE